MTDYEAIIFIQTVMLVVLTLMLKKMRAKEPTKHSTPLIYLIWPIPLTYANYRYSRKLEKIIKDAERQQNINLSWGAKKLLIIPVLESTILTNKEPEWLEVEPTIRDIIATVAQPISTEQPSMRERYCKAIIRAFHKRYCNIPPFCARTDN